MLAALLSLMVACASAPGPADHAPVLSEVPAWQDAVPRPDPLLPAGNATPYQVLGKTYQVMASAEAYQAQGTASWYGMKFQGRPTANGEIFDVYAPTAAHRSLPIPSYIRVTNLNNDRSVVLRVNDRGPFHPDRLIDLSYGAAVQLGFAEQGTTPVVIEAINLAGVDDRRSLSASTYRFLQLGAYQSEETATELAQSVRQRWDYAVSVDPVDSKGARMYRVRVGPFEHVTTLEQASARLTAGGYGPLLRIP
jgi:rare lipoprotein A